MSFLDQIEKSRREMVKLKKQCPWLFPLWHEMKQAKKDLEVAQARFDEAKALWQASKDGKAAP